MSSVTRINRFLASAGLGSRRKCEDLVRSGAVSVNGREVADLSVKVDVGADIVTVNGKRVLPPGKTRLFVLNKPAGVLCSVSDDRNRRTVIDIAVEKGCDKRLFPVGRLDMYTSGIILLTDDGELSYRLTHPRFKIDKIYIVVVGGEIADADIDRIASGVDLDGEMTQPCGIVLMDRNSSESRMEVTLREGKNRQIRRSFMKFGYTVKSLHRKALGELEFRGLAEGDMRALTDEEEGILRRQTGLSQGVGK